MSKIKVLPDALANKIAAGEVVERPASVVKELIENALDAGARKINIAVEAGGKNLITVFDDGEGMTRDDAIIAFERHATSKLRAIEDLEAISTLGFRGEALPSIASVSRLFLRTKTASDTEGTEVEFTGGKLVAVRDVAWPGGTEIEVKDLFFNMPARRKFLKSDATESFHITNLVQHYALANPQVAFLLLQNARETIRAAPAASLRERAYQILGRAHLEKLVEVNSEAERYRVYGFVSNPQDQRTSRDAQYLFINRRFVRDQLIGRALTEAYRSTMPSGAHPSAVLFIDAPPDEVDVNVHPAKTQVRFLNEGATLGFVRDAVAQALRATQAVVRLPGIRAGETHSDELRPAAARFAAPRSGVGREPFGLPGREERSIQGPAPDDAQLRGGGASGPGLEDAARTALEAMAEFTAAAQPELNQEPSLFASEAYPPEAQVDLGAIGVADAGGGARPIVSGSGGLRQSASERQSDPAASAPSVSEPPSAAEALPGLGHGIKPLGQIRDSYIIATDEEGLLLIDQHVAHERVLFEQFRDNRLARPASIQPLLIPQTLDLSPAQAAAFGVVQTELENMGIEAAELSGRTIAIKTAPSGLSSADVAALVRELLEVVERERRSLTLQHIRDQIAASLACKAAIKINMPLTNEKMQWLIDELMKTQNPMTCPHGRPIIMRMGLRDIERGFKRPV